MPEAVSNEDAHSDPSVTKQFDTKTSLSNQFQDLWKIISDTKVCMLTTHRPEVGLMARSMTLAKRHGIRFLFLTNKHSQKVLDLEHSQDVLLTFQNTKTGDWVSINGTAQTKTDTSKVKELYSPTVSAWFGDLGDGKHDGTAEDPRMVVIEVEAKYIICWKSETQSSLGYIAEIASSVVTGQVAKTGYLREFTKDDLANPFATIRSG